MKTRLKLVSLTVIICTLLSSCAHPFAFFSGVSDDAPDSAYRTEIPAAKKYAEDAAGWVTSTLVDYAHREYNAGESVIDINLLYMGYRYCLANAKKLNDVITSGGEEYPDTISISGTEMERVCKNLISSDFSLSDYHGSLGADKYYGSEDLYMFNNGRDYWMGDNYSVNSSTARVLEDGKISVEACVYHYPSVGLAENFRMLEYTVEPIEDGDCVYFKLHRITDKGSAEGLEREAVVSLKSYQKLDDLTYPYDGAEWDKRPLLAEAKLTVPMIWSVGGEEILSVRDFEDSTMYVRCMQFELIKVNKDYVLTHGIHDLRTPEEMRKYRDSDEAAVVWRFYDEGTYKPVSGRSAAGYDYISYYMENIDDDGKKDVSEQRYYRVSDEYVLSVYYGGCEDVAQTVQTSLDGMTFEAK